MSESTFVSSLIIFVTVCWQRNEAEKMIFSDAKIFWFSMDVGSTLGVSRTLFAFFYSHAILQGTTDTTCEYRP